MVKFKFEKAETPWEKAFTRFGVLMTCFVYASLAFIIVAVKTNWIPWNNLCGFHLSLIAVAVVSAIVLTVASVVFHRKKRLRRQASA